MLQNQILKSQIFGEGMLTREDRYSKTTIKHIPIMVAKDERIICLPEYNEMFHIGFTGMTGKGKGIGGNTLLGFEYWIKKRERACMILNDFQRETFEYSFPCLNRKFQDNLRVIKCIYRQNFRSKFLC